MSDNSRPGPSQLRAALLPDLIYSIAGPFLIYRLAAPYMPATYALLLAGLLPLLRVGVGFLRRRRLNLIGLFSLLAIAIKIVSALVLKDPRIVLVGDSLITAAYGILLLASLFSSRPLILRFIESVLANAPAARGQQAMRRWQQTDTRAFFRIITAVWGVALLLEFVVRLFLALTLPLQQFLVISPFVRYGFLGGMLLWLLLFVKIRRSRQQQKSTHTLEQQEQETTSTPIS